MMSALQPSRLNSTTGVISFTRQSERDKALRHVKGKGVPKRNFMHINNGDARRFIREFENMISL